MTLGADVDICVNGKVGSHWCVIAHWELMLTFVELASGFPLAIFDSGRLLASAGKRYCALDAL